MGSSQDTPNHVLCLPLLCKKKKKKKKKHFSQGMFNQRSEKGQGQIKSSQIGQNNN